jgi:hypothetical protein
MAAMPNLAWNWIASPQLPRRATAIATAPINASD